MKKLMKKKKEKTMSDEATKQIIDEVNSRLEHLIIGRYLGVKFQGQSMAIYASRKEKDPTIVYFRIFSLNAEQLVRAIVVARNEEGHILSTAVLQSDSVNPAEVWANLPNTYDATRVVLRLEEPQAL